MKTLISSQLLQLLKNYNSKNLGPVNGDLYGLTDHSERQFVLSLCSVNHQLQHDPTLLLSSSFTKLGTFHHVWEDISSSLNIQENHIAITCINDVIQLYSCDLSSKKAAPEDFESFDETELIENFILARVCFSFDFSCRDKTADVKNVVSSRKEMVCSSDAFFKSRQFNLLFQNKIDDNVLFLDGTTKRDETHPISSLFGIPKKKKTNFDVLNFDLYENKSKGPSSAPIVQITSNRVNFLRTSLKGQAVVYIPKSLVLSKVAAWLSNAVSQHLQLSEFWLVKQLKDDKTLSPLQTYPTKHFCVGHLMTPIYPKNCDESHLQSYRSQIHKAFLLPSDSPVVSKLNAYCFPGDKKTTQVLVNPHIVVPPSGVGEQSVVQGLYGYHHYMQDSFDDNKWGCAYRSLQTLISWFRMQGYTDEPVPSHHKIQQVLVDMKDKPASFVGSKEWIGSTEVAYVLESLLNVSSNFISVNNGSDLESKGRELAMHFDNIGTPIMIGGGALAHTILGVDWNSETGDIKFLILDPHYTGTDDLSPIIKQGFCGWKGPSFWNANSFYNLCLPQRPKII